MGTDSAAVTKRCFVPFSAIVSPDSVSCYPDEVSMMGTDAGGALNNPMKLDYSHQEYDSVKRYYVNVYESFSANSADFEKAQLQIKWNSSSVKEMTDNGGTLSAYKGIASSPEDLKAENKLSDNAWTEDGAEGAKTKILTVEDKFGDADNLAVYTIVYQYKRAYLKDDGTTEMADTYKSIGKTLIDVLKELYQTYGRYKSELKNYTFEGAEAKRRMEYIRKSLAEKPEMKMRGSKVVQYKDYLEGVDGLPKSDVIKLWMEDGSEVVIRPSGTEPKIKVYTERKEA